jgi:hypothetical protein
MAPCFETPARARLDNLGGTVAEPAAAVEQGTPAVQVAKEPALPPADESCERYANARSERSDQPLNFRVANETNMELSVAWIDYNGQRGSKQIVPAGQMFGGGSFATHPFEFTGTDGACLKIIVLEAGVEDYIVGP